MLNEEATVGVRIVTTDVNSGAATTQVAGNLAKMNTSAELLMQQQMQRERQVEQMLLSQGIRPSPGSGNLTAKELRQLGLSEAQLATLGMGRTGITREGEQMGWGTRSALEKFPGLGGLGSIMGFGGGTLALGAAGLGTAALASGVGDLIKSYREHLKSVADLTSAYTNAGLNVDQAAQSIDKWIDKNGDYINNVNDAREGFAKLTIAGLSQNDVMKAMNDALALAAYRHISLSDAVEIVDKLTQGQAKSLIDMGIHLKGYDEVTGKATGSTKTVKERLDDLGAKLPDVSKTTDTLAKAQNEFGRDMDKIATNVGPAFLAALSGMVTAMDAAARAIGWLTDTNTDRSKVRPDTYQVGIGPFSHTVTNPYALPVTTVTRRSGSGGGL